MKNRNLILVDGIPINYYVEDEKDFINITDIAKGFESGSGAIENWMRNRNTVEFLGTWESIYNPSFNSVGFDGIKTNVGLNTFKLSAQKWIHEPVWVLVKSKISIVFNSRVSKA